jgi:hypothetical protein
MRSKEEIIESIIEHRTMAINGVHAMWIHEAKVAMDAYATQQTASLQSRIKSLEQRLSDCERKRLTGERL